MFATYMKNIQLHTEQLLPQERLAQGGISVYNEDRDYD